MSPNELQHDIVSIKLVVKCEKVHVAAWLNIFLSVSSLQQVRVMQAGESLTLACENLLLPAETSHQTGVSWPNWASHTSWTAPRASGAVEPSITPGWTSPTTASRLTTPPPSTWASTSILQPSSSTKPSPAEVSLPVQFVFIHSFSSALTAWAQIWTRKLT